MTFTIEEAGGDPNLPWGVSDERGEFICLCFDKESAERIANALNVGVLPDVVIEPLSDQIAIGKTVCRSIDT